MSIESFRPWHLENGPSLQQQYERLHLGADIDPRLWRTPYLSQQFIQHYGRPRVHAHVWKILSSYKVNRGAYVPNFRGNFLAIENLLGYARFANNCFNKASKRQIPFMPTRLDMDAAWVQLLLWKFDRMTAADRQRYVGKTLGSLSEYRPTSSLDDVTFAMRIAFTRGVESIYSKKTEKFWNAMRSTKFPELDIKKTGELWVTELFIPFDDNALERAMSSLDLGRTDNDDSDYIEKEEEQSEAEENWLVKFKKDRRDAAVAEGRVLDEEDEDEDENDGDGDCGFGDDESGEDDDVE